MKYVIIGNSAAGIGTVEGIRQIDQEGEILIITDEVYHTYSRPLISYLLLGKTTEEKMKYREDDFYTRNRCTLMVKSKVTAIDGKQKQLTISTPAGFQVTSYDKLMVATGSSPFVPPFEGLDSVENKFTFMTLNDAKELEKAINKESKVLVIGAGLIGLKCAEGISQRAGKITVVDLAPNILSSILDTESASIIQQHLEDNGIEFQLSHSVKKFNFNTAFLDNNDIINFDVVVLAVGVRPNTQLLDGLAKIERGIVIDSTMQTTHPDIYAAGDCTLSYDVSSQSAKILALLPNAYIQGECAGVNMAGDMKSFDNALPMNAIGFFGLPMVTAGTYIGEVYTEQNGKNLKKLFYQDNLLKGFILIGNIEKAGIYTSLIRDMTPLDSIDFPLICKHPGLMAFTQSDRTMKLGGVI